VGLKRSLKADLSLILVSAIWGATFVVVKRALDDATPFAFLAMRFTLAALLLAWPLRKAIFPFNPREALAGGVLGVFLGGGFAFQTVGLLYTTPSRSAFITGLYVVGVPVLAALLRLRGFNAASLGGVGLALAGLYLLTGMGSAADGAGLGRGEILTLCCAATFAAHIVSTDVYSRRHDTRALTFWQVATAALISFPLAGLAESPRVQPTASLAGAVLITAVLATALTVAIQTHVQAWTSPTRVAIIFTMEPVFAALTSYIVEGERMTAVSAAGAGLILAGMLVSEIPAARSKPSVGDADPATS